jgi:two-component system chemotaxis response regulator CheY
VRQRTWYLRFALKELAYRECLPPSPAVSCTMRMLPATRQGTAGCGMPFKILIVDDSSSIRKLLRFFIEHNTDWQVCGEAENGQVGVEKVRELKPHAVILDLSVPVMNGLEAAREITRTAPNVQMVMFTMHICEQLRRDAQAAGIKDVISKSDTIGGHLFASLKDHLRSAHPSLFPVEKMAS